MAPLERIFEADIRNLFDTGVIGTMRVTQQFISHFKKRRAGVILTVTLLAGTIAFLRDAVYGTAKRAQEDMVESLYYEMEPFGVAVKSIIPGGTKTNFRTPLNDLTGYERAAANQRKYLRDSHTVFCLPKKPPAPSGWPPRTEKTGCDIRQAASAGNFMDSTPAWVPRISSSIFRGYCLKNEKETVLEERQGVDRSFICLLTEGFSYGKRCFR